MNPDDKHARISRYQDSYLGDYGFEAVMVAARRRAVLESLSRRQPRIVLEIGCGADLLSTHALAAGLPIERWVIVEPAEQFVRAAQAAPRSRLDLRVVQGFLEDSVPSIQRECGEPPDFIILSAVLHEVSDPDAILRAARLLLAPGGTFHVNVPNAFSFHRRLARAMGLIADERSLGDRNQALAQYRVFDLPALVAVVEKAGFVVERSGGYLLKPFTHKQLESIPHLMTPEVLAGLWQLGQELPEWASEIYVDTRTT